MQYISELSKIDPVRFEDILAMLPPIEQLTDEQLRQLLKTKELLADRERQYAILYYKPQSHQELFHRSQKKLRMITGANQSGKSICATIEGIWMALGIHPYYPNKVPTRGRVVASDLQKGIGENIQGLYEQFAPPSEIKIMKKYPGGQICKIYWQNGSTTDFLSYEQDTKIFEGWVGDWVQFDEPPPRDKFIACMRGLMRRQGRCWLALTPLSEPWIYDDIYLQAGEGADRPDVFVFDITDNKYLSEAEIRDFESRLTPDEKEARLHGRFKHLSGLIYKEFKTDVHCIDSFDIPDDWTRYCAMDYHARMPCAVVWIAVDPKGIAYVYDELWIDKTIKEIADAIKAKEGKDVVRVRWIDPLSATPDRVSGTSPQREFLKYRLAFRSATKDWVLGKNIVCEYLKLGKDGKPGIYFFRDRVPRCVEAISHYQWDEYSDSREGEKETPKKKYAHFPDALRYILVNRPTYQNKTIQSEFERQIEYSGHRFTGYSFG